MKKLLIQGPVAKVKDTLANGYIVCRGIPAKVLLKPYLIAGVHTYTDT